MLVKRSLVLLTVVAMVGCNTPVPSMPKVSVDTDPAKATVSTETLGSVSVGTTGAEVDNSQFNAKVTACSKGGSIADAGLSKLGPVGRFLNRIISCPTEGVVGN